MSIITLLTDSGHGDHYVAAIKARIMTINPTITIVDISHNIAPGDIAHAAFLLNSVFRDFPVGTVHLVGVNSIGNRDDAFIALQLENHFFVGVDNGFFGLISEKNHQEAVQLNSLHLVITSFPEKVIFAAAAAELASGTNINTLGKPMTSCKKLIPRHLRQTSRSISGNVLRVDWYGNLITNISQMAFETLQGDRSFTIKFGGRKSTQIHKQYFEAERGEYFLIFNSLGLLEIGMYKSHASSLLGLDYDSQVNIVFDG